MVYLERMEGQDHIDKIREYLAYCEEHLEFVRQAFILVYEACDGKMMWAADDMSYHTILHQVKQHDLSKFSMEEFIPYRKRFYPIDEDETTTETKMEFRAAWQNHKKHNTHHHETVENYLDVVHMVIDWTAMGFKFGDTAQEYYEANAHRISLKPEFKEEMYKIFECIAEHRAKLQAEGIE